MGLAASQARLLSITSRISDNELRAQLINNQKMRLATESSQVSENYISALNKSKLVFANYDKDDNAQNVPLTFNNLTAFNQYNNQYGLTNAAGNILISEREAELYKASVAAADPAAEFLRKHGIEYTTSYWATLDEQLKQAEMYYSTPNGDGELTVDDGTYAFYTAEQLKKMYEGYEEGGVEIPSYDETINTKEYTDFEKYADDFEMAIAEVQGAEAEQAALQAEFISALLGSTSYTTFSSIADGSAATGILAAINANFNGITGDLATALSESNFMTANNIKKDGSDYYTLEAANVAYSEYDMVVDSSGTRLTSSDGGSTWKFDGEDVSVSQTAGPPNRKLTITYTETDASGAVIGTESENYLFEISGTTANVYAQLTTTELDSLAGQFISDTVMDFINSEIANGATINPSGSVAGSFTEEELSLLQGATNITTLGDVVGNLAEAIFGDMADNYITYTITDPATGAKTPTPTEDEAYQLLAILNYLTAGNTQWKETGTQNIGKDIKGNDVSFNWDDLAISQNVINAYAIDTMMDLFGEPVYGYLYTDEHGVVQEKNGNVDASAEAEWYLNLFDKIQSSGYQVLANGLASSTEWLQFALENGIVVMEQINGEGEWQGITYTSCSDISEQTDETAVTLAEAEYNQAMRQIEAKDEMYDMELKNIDTEHSSLQAEYESVKKAMSGNIERNFQMYS